MDCDWKWLDFNTVKTRLVSLNSCAIDVKKNRYVLGEKSTSKMLGLSFLSKLDWDLKMSLLLKLHIRKLEP